MADDSAPAGDLPSKPSSPVPQPPPVPSPEAPAPSTSDPAPPVSSDAPEGGPDPLVPSVPPQAAPLPQPTVPKKQHKRTPKKTIMSEVAAQSIAPWVESHDVELAVSSLRLDETRSQGQIRSVDRDRVKELYSQLCSTPPTSWVRVTVWRTSEDGVSVFVSSAVNRTQLRNVTERYCFGLIYVA